MGEVRRDVSLDFGGSDLDLSLGSSSSSSTSSNSSRTGAEGCSSSGSGAPGAAPSPVLASSTITCLTGRSWSGCCWASNWTVLDGVMVLEVAETEEGRRLTSEGFLLSRGSDESRSLSTTFGLDVGAPGAAPLVAALPLGVFWSTLDLACCSNLALRGGPGGCWGVWGRSRGRTRGGSGGGSDGGGSGGGSYWRTSTGEKFGGG